MMCRMLQMIHLLSSGNMKTPKEIAENFGKYVGSDDPSYVDEVMKNLEGEIKKIDTERKMAEYGYRDLQRRLEDVRLFVKHHSCFENQEGAKMQLFRILNGNRWIPCPHAESWVDEGIRRCKACGKHLEVSSYRD